LSQYMHRPFATKTCSRTRRPQCSVFVLQIPQGSRLAQAGHGMALSSSPPGGAPWPPPGSRALSRPTCASPTARTASSPTCANGTHPYRCAELPFNPLLFGDCWKTATGTMWRLHGQNGRRVKGWSLQSQEIDERGCNVGEPRAHVVIHLHMNKIIDVF
jgi:hypothetical protein